METMKMLHVQIFSLLILIHMAALCRSGCPCKNEIRNYNICMKSSNSCGSHLSKFEECTNDRFTSMETEMKVLKEAIPNVSGTKHVSFMAYSSANITLTPGNFLKFGSVTINKGNGYDDKTGVFTAPVAGTYYITLTIGMPTPSSASDYLRLDILHNNKKVGYWWTGWKGMWVKISENILLDMKKGGKVSIKVNTWPKEYSHIGDKTNSNFHGFLIH